MKKAVIFIFALVVCFVLIDSQNQFTTASAQSIRERASKNSSVQQDRNDKEAEMGRLIKRLTKRSSDNLKTYRTAQGAYSMNLEDGFQNLMIARINPEAEAEGACITSLDEANAFFGKNLETGERVPQIPFKKQSQSLDAAQYGMSQEEYDFYTNLIEQSSQNQSASLASIVISPQDGAGEGFYDQTAATPEGGNDGTTLGQQRLNLFNRAAAIWSAFLDVRVPITVTAQFNPQTCTVNSATLGSAGTTSIYRDFSGNAYPNTWYSYALANNIYGADIDATTAEINATFNSSINSDPNCLGGRRWYYGYDNVTPSGTVNLLVVLLHEMGHGLGFQSFVNGSTGQLAGNINGRFPDVFTKNIYDRTQGKYWSEMTDADRQVSKLNAGNVLWDGPNVKVASSFLSSGRDAATGRVQLYTPATYAPGSSISHFDTASFPNLLMEPNITINLPLTLDLTRQQMRDIGWFRDTTGDGVPDSISNVQVGGSSLTIGSTATVTWTNDGGFNRPVNIELSTDGGASYQTVIASNVANVGSYNFNVPNLPTTLAKIRVREADFINPSSESVTAFTIASAATVTVSGRVLTSFGRGIPRALVTISGPNGFSQSVYTDRLGDYQFTGVPSGANYSFSVRSRYRFRNPTTVYIDANVSDLNLTALN